MPFIRNSTYSNRSPRHCSLRHWLLRYPLAFRQFVAIQRQPLHMLLWSGVGAVALAFTFFLSTLFLLKISGAYSRGTFIFQFLAISFAVCLIRTIFYFWLQSAIRAGLVEARHVVLIGDEQQSVASSLIW